MPLPRNSYGIGMIVGSSLGGLLAEKFGHFLVAVLAAGLSLSAVPLSYAWLPSSSAKAVQSQAEAEKVRRLMLTLYFP
jgi:predicted MFS family arabinose efflux permease